MNIFGMITTHSSKDYLFPALDSFFSFTKLQEQDRFILIDNDFSLSSNDLSSYPKVELHQNQQPLSFAGNANQLIDIALPLKGDLFLLNNDLIFSDGWLAPLAEHHQSATSPLTNREVQYKGVFVVQSTGHVSSEFSTADMRELKAYQNNPHLFQAIAVAHANAMEGNFVVFRLPFCCIRIPYVILEAVGHFDTSYGVGGGEDFDYCMRIWLAGFSVRYAIKSLVHHFEGKSTFSGVETSEQTNARVEKFRKVFADKWGPALYDVMIMEKTDRLAADPDLRTWDREKKLDKMIQKLLGDKVIAIKM